MSRIFARNIICHAGMAAGLLLAACSSDDANLRRHPQYQAGYSAGCQTAHTRVEGFRNSIHRDDALYEASKSYRAGWRSGLSACGGNLSASRDRDVFGDTQNYGRR
jgi:hypothetical protein